MAAGLPVMATRVRPIERILMANDCGISCNEDDPTDVARCLAILRNPITRQRLGNNGHATILRQYNWTKDEQRMLEVLTGLGRQ
jgi:glycosyltransferase involved in cell wall biosynthesis